MEAGALDWFIIENGLIPFSGVDRDYLKDVKTGFGGSGVGINIELLLTLVALTLVIVLLILVLTLAVGWQILVWSGAGSVERGLTNLDWIFFVLGAVCFLLIIVGLVWLCAWLVREIGVNQHQRAFLDAVTHEMKTPLASLRLYVDTLERHDPDRERRCEFLERMRGDLERLDQTVEQVLTAARAEESRSRAHLERVALSGLLEECISEIRASYHLPEGAVRLEAGRGTTVKGDAGELSQLRGLGTTPALREFIAVNEEATDICLAAQGMFDATKQREILEDVPWITEELKTVIEVVFDCVPGES